MAQAAALDDVAGAWLEAAERLKAVFAHTSDEDVRSATLQELVRQLGGIGYPGFLKILLIVADSNDRWARRELARVLGGCLQRVDLPAGELTSWGAASMWSGQESIPAAELRGEQGLGVGPRRRFGPLEYLTVWYCQRTQRPYLSESAYREAMESLIGLLNEDERARTLYPLKLENDLAAGLDGAYTQRVRMRLQALTRAWQQGRSPAAIVDAALDAQATTRASERNLWVGDH